MVNKILAVFLLLFSASSFGAGYADYKSTIDSAAAKYGVDPGILAGLIEQESNFNSDVCSGKNACGLTQITKPTAGDLGVTDRFDSTQSINGGAKYMSQLLNRYGGDYTKALAAYNAGMANVDKYGGIPPFAETQAYVPSVLAKAKKYGSDVAALGYDPSKVDMTNHNTGLFGTGLFASDGIAGGGSGNTGSHFFEALFQKIDTSFKPPITEFGNRLSAGISTIGYTLIWLMIIFFLFKVAFKQATVDFGDAIRTYTMAFLVIVFAFNFTEFMSFLGDDVLEFADAIISLTTNSPNAGALLDDYVNNSISFLDEVWTKAGMTSQEGLAYLTMGLVTFIAVLAFGVSAFLAIAIAKIIIFVFIVFAPIFILSLLFQSTANMFSTWISFLFASGIVQAVAATILSVFVAISENTISASEIDVSDVMAFISILAIGTYLFAQLDSLVRGATGSISVSGGSLASSVNKGLGSAGKGLTSAGFAGANIGLRSAWGGAKTMSLDTAAYAKNLAATGKWR